MQVKYLWKIYIFDSVQLLSETFPLSEVNWVSIFDVNSFYFDLYYDNVYKNCISSRRRVYGVAKKQVIFGFVKLKGSDDDGICPIYYHVTIEQQK